MDENKIKQFWEARGEKFGKLSFESVANLEEDSNNLEIKIRDEQDKVFNWFNPLGLTILDLAAGIGQWAFRFQERGALAVDAVDFSKSFVDIGKAEAKKRKISEVNFIHSSAQNFEPKKTYDVIFISGLFVYLEDENANKVIQIISSCLNKNGKIILRDGTSLKDEHKLNNIYSDHLKEYYSAFYRSPDIYITMFKKFGLKCCRHENMFPEGHPLNKYPETRLHLFEFIK